MNTQRKMNTYFTALRKGMRQLGYAVLATLPMLGSVHGATDEVVYFHTDALGSPVAAFSETGEVCWTETYSPYGEKLDKEDSLPPTEGCGLLGTDVGYTGHVQDGSGLVYAQQRYYDPVIGRFMSTDPKKPTAGDPHYFGRYHYGGNNPYKHVDPNGKAFIIAGVPPLVEALGLITLGVGAKATIDTVEALNEAPPGRLLSESPEEVKVKVSDLDRLHDDEVIGDRPDLKDLTDQELLDAVNKPANKDKLKRNKKTGKLMDGNSRAKELEDRSNDPDSSIDPDTEVSVEEHTPDDSEFWDM